MAAHLLDSAEATAWSNQRRSLYSGNRAFGKIAAGVIWTASAVEGGEPLVPVDPSVLVEHINADGLPLLRGHDPGCPVGRVLEAEIFSSSQGVKFVAAIFGFYDPVARVSFRDLGQDSSPAAISPTQLTALSNDSWLLFESDPREVDAEWRDEVLRDVPLRVHRKESSHNAAEPLLELITIGLPYVVFVWNPFVKTIATEAGKDVYAAIHRWLRTLWEKLAQRRNPIVQISGYQGGCKVSFLIRGNDVKTNYAAHDALPIAAAQAAKLIAAMNGSDTPPRSLVYEFEPQESKWYPSYAELNDGRLISDRNILIAIEQLPSGLSLGIGITQNTDERQLPR